MIGAAAAAPLPFGLERLAAVAIGPLYALVDVARVVDRLDELLAAGVMPRLARLDELVVRDVEGTPDLLELAGHVVDVWLGGEPSSRARCEHLDRVLIVPHQEVDSNPSIRRKRAWTSAPIFSNAVPMCGRLFG